MDFKRRFELKDKHAVFSASQPTWIRYTSEKLAERYSKLQAATLGTRKHNMAAELISLGIKLPNTSQTLNMYVNDCIGYFMKPEVVLFYSYNFFGTADAIEFSNRTLRIFDLKTGEGPPKEDQLKAYAALFCLDYDVKPFDIEYDLRFYQHDEITNVDVDPEEILNIMDTIVTFDKLLKQWESEDN